MKKTSLSISIIALSFTNVISQNIPDKYFSLVRKADSLYENKEYYKSAFMYSEAFKANNWKGLPNDRYNAACSWAKANYPDSALYNLNKIAFISNYTNYNHIINDKDLFILHDDKRWITIIEQVKLNKDKADANLNKPLVNELDSIFIEDQKYRNQLPSIEEKFGRDSKEIKVQWRKIQSKDSINLIKVKNILDKYGWLGYDLIGSKGNGTLFLVIQHADLNTQMKYLPMMRDAVKIGKASPSDLALLEDRVLMRQGKKQIYGSQIARNPKTGEYYVAPLADPDNVDNLRFEMGLPKLADYIKNWNLVWDVEKYKKQLPELEKEMDKNKY
jgi:hypothetical protein